MKPNYKVVCVRCEGKPYTAYEGLMRSYAIRRAFELLTHEPNCKLVYIYRDGYVIRRCFLKNGNVYVQQPTHPTKEVEQ